jgi:hypothetical protein
VIRHDQASVGQVTREWRWVDVDRIGRRSFGDLIRRGWVESDGNGRVRPTSRFPDAVARALAAIV